VAEPHVIHRKKEKKKKGERERNLIWQIAVAGRKKKKKKESQTREEGKEKDGQKIDISLGSRTPFMGGVGEKKKKRGGRCDLLQLRGKKKKKERTTLGSRCAPGARIFRKGGKKDPCVRDRALLTKGRERKPRRYTPPPL